MITVTARPKVCGQLEKRIVTQNVGDGPDGADAEHGGACASAQPWPVTWHRDTPSLSNELDDMSLDCHGQQAHGLGPLRWPDPSQVLAREDPADGEIVWALR